MQTPLVIFCFAQKYQEIMFAFAIVDNKQIEFHAYMHGFNIEEELIGNRSSYISDGLINEAKDRSM